MTHLQYRHKKLLQTSRKPRNNLMPRLVSISDSKTTEISIASSGTVALCAGCNAMASWAAVVVGAVSGPLFLFGQFALTRFGIDDPLDAIPVHGVGGFWGTLSVYIFKSV